MMLDAKRRRLAHIMVTDQRAGAAHIMVTDQRAGAHNLQVVVVASSSEWMFELLTSTLLTVFLSH